MRDVILASSSIYRKQQLQRLGFEFSCVSPEVDEALYKTSELDHLELSRKLSLLKARAVANTSSDAIVIGGDQLASFNGQILSKPKTPEKATQQLRLLSGNKHQLYTSLAIIADGREYLHTCVANMHMRQLSEVQIKRYIDIDQPLACCGSYRLEALGISLFEKIDCDDFSSIIGIPLMWTAKTLSELGLAVP